MLAQETTVTFPYLTFSLENGVRNTDLADIMEKSRNPDAVPEILMFGILTAVFQLVHDRHGIHGDPM